MVEETVLLTSDKNKGLFSSILINILWFPVLDKLFIKLLSEEEENLEVNNIDRIKINLKNNFLILLNMPNYNPIIYVNKLI